MIALVLSTGATGDLVAAIQQADVRVPLAAVLLDQAETVRLLPKTDDGRQIPAYGYLEAAAAAVTCAARYGAWRAAPRGVVPKLADIRGDDARALVREFLGTGDGGWLPPEVTAALLRCYGIPLAELVPVHSEDEAVAAFAAGGGVPVVLKADVPGLVHKTEAGGVGHADAAAGLRVGDGRGAAVFGG